MIDDIVALIVDESKWMTFSMGLAFLFVGLLLYTRRNPDLPLEGRVLAAMNLFFGITTGTMAFGHLLAVTTKLVVGTLEGSLLKFYAIGIALAVPSWWIVWHTRIILALPAKHRKTTLLLNSWMGITLLALGIPNLPLAIPAMFNIGYLIASRPALRWAIVGTAIVVNVGLFIGSLVFLASGQTFEQFRGME